MVPTPATAAERGDRPRDDREGAHRITSRRRQRRRDRRRGRHRHHRHRRERPDQRTRHPRRPRPSRRAAARGVRRRSRGEAHGPHRDDRGDPARRPAATSSCGSGSRLCFLAGIDSDLLYRAAVDRAARSPRGTLRSQNTEAADGSPLRDDDAHAKRRHEHAASLRHARAARATRTSTSSSTAIPHVGDPQYTFPDGTLDQVPRAGRAARLRADGARAAHLLRRGQHAHPRCARAPRRPRPRRRTRAGRRLTRSCSTTTTRAASGPSVSTCSLAGTGRSDDLSEYVDRMAGARATARVASAVLRPRYRRPRAAAAARRPPGSVRRRPHGLHEAVRRTRRRRTRRHPRRARRRQLLDQAQRSLPSRRRTHRWRR